MIGIPLGLAAANAGEWAIHKYVLHGLGRKKSSTWSFHWHNHHRNARKHDHRDPDYDKPLWRNWNGQTQEAVGLSLVALAFAPLFPIAPWFVGSVWYSQVNYYRKHKRAHRDPEWARRHLPWHYDHHMGPDQHANWCVTNPWFDEVMGTRVPYVGTAREAQDRARSRRAASLRHDRSAAAVVDADVVHAA